MNLEKEQPETSKLPLPETVELSRSQFQALLRTLSHQAGSMAELSRRLGVSGQFIGDVCSGKKRAGPKLLRALRASMKETYIVPLETK